MLTKEITLKLTSEQYRDLVETFFIGKWIAEEEADAEKESSLENLEQLLLACSGTKANNSFVDYDKENDYYSLSEEIEDELMEQIENYDESQFWEILVSRLTMRDLHSKYSEDELEAMPEDKGMKALEEIQKQYFAEFEENDVDNLKLVKLRKV
jgi:hypothetical protein